MLGPAAHQTTCDVEERAHGAVRVEELLQVRPDLWHHSEDGDLAQVGRDPQSVVAEDAGVDRLGIHAASGALRPGRFHVVVRGEVGIDEADGRLGLEELDHLRDGVQERVDLRRRVAVAAEVLEVADDLLPGVVDLRGAGGVARDVQPSAGQRGRAAEVVGLLQDEDGQSFVCRGHRGRQPGGPGPDDDEVVLGTLDTWLLDTWLLMRAPGRRGGGRRPGPTCRRGRRRPRPGRSLR